MAGHHDLFSLMLHKEAAEMIKNDKGLIDEAKNILLRWKTMHGEFGVLDWDEWLKLIEAGDEIVLDMMTQSGEHATRLRQSSPFSCLVPNRRRWALLNEAIREKGRA
jgi:hypothetical protein